MKKYSIVIPCYNEEKNIPLILDKFQKVINRDDIEILLINNGSQDQSKKVLNELVPQYPFAEAVEVEVNRGYGFGILYGLNQAKGDYLGWTHADMQTDPIDVIKAIEIIQNNHSPTDIFVKGSRKNRPLVDQFFTGGMSMFESVYLREKLQDINAQPNIFHRSFLLEWENPPYDFSLDLYALYMAKKRGLNIHRFNVIFPDRIHGQSSWNTGIAAKAKFIKRTLHFSSRLKKELGK
ncbi:glycosyltransferase family 2 protein [Jeotgalibacillus marinus]|uniref:Glycosyltransferase family 2 protein n=1 Tax=Jeotgalibacillus marinus TaxID=86667 RepID=A0ABV3Q139_9BACL